MEYNSDIDTFENGWQCAIQEVTRLLQDRISECLKEHASSPMTTAVKAGRLSELNRILVSIDVIKTKNHD